MKKIKFLPIFLIVCVVLSMSVLPVASAIENPEVGARAVVLLDMESGKTFFEKNPNDRVEPASVTKIMTVLLAAEACVRGDFSLADEVIAVDSMNYDLIADGSTANILIGESLTLEQLMNMAMVVSANDACNVIAEYIGGNITNFIDLMNKRAVELGCTGTNFANTHGLPNDNHYTTAWDMSLIAREAAAIGMFADIWSGKSYYVEDTNMSETRSYQNTNALLGDNSSYSGYQYEFATGGKTGHTTAAGYCLVSTAAKGNISLLAVVMGAEATDNSTGGKTFGQFSDSITLYDWAFENFSYREVLRSTEIIKEIPVEMGSNADSVSVRPENSVSALIPNDMDVNIFRREVEIFSEVTGEKLHAPILAGNILGQIIITNEGISYGKVNLVAANGVDLSKIHYMKTQVDATLQSGPVKAVFWIMILLLVTYIVLVVRYRILRMRHNQSVRQARRERAAKMAEQGSRQYTGAAHHATALRGDMGYEQDAEVEFFTNDDEYYEEDYEEGYEEDYEEGYEEEDAGEKASVVDTAIETVKNLFDKIVNRDK